MSDLELVEIPPRNAEGKLMAVIVTGDGGWVGIDKDIGRYLAAHDIPVVGLSSVRYFWNKKTPDQASKDLARILNYYLYAWKREEAILVGYSRGADVIPFMADRLPPDLLEKVRLMVLLGPEKTEDFEFHFSDLIPDYVPTEDYQVLPEVQRLRAKRFFAYMERKRPIPCAGSRTPGRSSFTKPRTGTISAQFMIQ